MSINLGIGNSEKHNGVHKVRLFLTKDLTTRLIASKTNNALKINLSRSISNIMLTAPKVDERDILSIEFDDLEDDPEFDFVVDVEMAYGHRELAQFVLDHKDHTITIEPVVIDGSDEHTIMAWCGEVSCNHKEDLVLDYRSLVGLWEGKPLEDE